MQGKRLERLRHLGQDSNVASDETANVRRKEWRGRARPFRARADWLQDSLVEAVPALLLHASHLHRQALRDAQHRPLHANLLPIAVGFPAGQLRPQDAMRREAPIGRRREWAREREQVIALRIVRVTEHSSSPYLP